MRRNYLVLSVEKRIHFSMENITSWTEMPRLWSKIYHAFIVIPEQNLFLCGGGLGSWAEILSENVVRF